MTRFPMRLTVLLLGLLLPLTAAAQDVKVQASVDATTIGAQETVTYRLDVQGASFGDVDTPEPPPTEGLTILQAIPSTQRNVQFFNGRMQQSIAFTWTYRPVREGAARFLPMDVTVKGETYRTEPITLSVVSRAQRPRQQSRRARRPFQSPFDAGTDDEAPRAIEERDLFIRALPSKQTAYKGEQVTIEYQLFFREGIQLRQSRLADSGDADGFWREELEVETRPIARTVIENGLRYSMITLKRVAVFPARTGTLTIEPLRIQTEAYVPFGSSDPFERFFSLRNQYQPVELASAPVIIDAQPLPEGAPDSFTGAVGTFSMQARLNDATVEVGEPVELELTLSGTGNLATLDPPPLETPGIFERYDPQVTIGITRSGQTVRGTKTVDYLLVPRSNGTFELPPIAFSYFSPRSETYETLTAPARVVTVTGTAMAPLAAGTTAEGLPVDDVASLMTGTVAWRTTGGAPLHSQAWPYAALALPLLGLLGLVGYLRYTERLAGDPAYARRRRAHPLARKHLKQAETLLQANRPIAFYEEVARAVQSFIGNRLNVAELGLTRPQLDTRLAQTGVASNVRVELNTLLDECDQARFSPVLPSQDAMNSAADRAARLIVTIDDQLTQTADATA